ncbi:hypothetical protein BJV78DRAFT_1171816, partial [Lactifluus subvellereus]
PLTSVMPERPSHLGAPPRPSLHHPLPCLRAQRYHLSHLFLCLSFDYLAVPPRAPL